MNISIGMENLCNAYKTDIDPLFLLFTVLSGSHGVRQIFIESTNNTIVYLFPMLTAIAPRLDGHSLNY